MDAHGSGLRDLYRSQDALGLAELVRKGEVTAAELLEMAIEVAEKVNPKLNAVVLAAYDTARQAVAAGLPDGPLRGVPFLLKDLNMQWTGQPVTNGCRLFRDHLADHDSELVRRYLAAGLVLFARTASPEFGLTTSTESKLHGKTRNPWHLDHAAGGSSGGAAAAVAAGIVPAAHASDGGGSIRIPASCCGLFGVKPSRARVPMGPDVGEGWSGMSTHHAVSRSVRDSAALLDLTAGPEVGDPYAAPPPQRPFLEEVGARLEPLRVALVTRAFNGAATHGDCVAAAEAAADLCNDLGHHVEPATFTVDSEQLGKATRTIVQASLRAALLERADELGREMTEEDVEPLTWAMCENAKADGATDYAKALKTIHRTGRKLGRFFQDYDLLLSPTMATPPPRLGELALDVEDTAAYMERLQETIGYTSLMNVAGNPAMSVPLHWNGDGLPIGVQFAAPFGDEAVLFRLAAQLEEALPWANRRPSL